MHQVYPAHTFTFGKSQSHTHTLTGKKKIKKIKKDLDDTIFLVIHYAEGNRALSPVQRIHLLEVDVVLKSVNN